MALRPIGSPASERTRPNCRRRGLQTQRLDLPGGSAKKAGLITCGPSPDHYRATLVTITGSGLALSGQVMPGHIQVTRRLLPDPLSDEDLHYLRDPRP